MENFPKYAWLEFSGVTDRGIMCWTLQRNSRSLWVGVNDLILSVAKFQINSNAKAL